MSSSASSEPGDVLDAPSLADALPPAEHHCGRAVAHLEGRAVRGDLLDALVALLEAAGGPDVGNAVRTHLERTGTPVPSPSATDHARLRVLLAAVRLHAAAERDLRDRLSAAGLVDDGSRGGPAGPSGRAARAEHARRVLEARRSAVHRVVAALAGGHLPATGDGPWPDALVGALPPGEPPELSQGETGRGPNPR